MLERGFHYFDSPENDDNDERIAYLFWYCSAAVEEWPRFRRWLEETGAKSAEQCDQIETNALAVFWEVRDTIATAIDTETPALMSQPRLLERLTHAHAFMALHADSTAMLAYRRMIYPQVDDLPWSSRPQQGDFDTAVWEGKWNASGDRMPSETTREETLRNWRAHETDGLRDRSDRRDPIAKAVSLEPLFPGTETVMQLFQAGEPRYRPPDERFLRTSSAIELAIRREEVRKLGTRSGLNKDQTTFLGRMIFDGAKQESNPAAWHAIRQAKCGSLMFEIDALLASRPGKLF